MIKRTYQRRPHIVTVAPSGLPLIQVELAYQRSLIDRHTETMHAIRAQLDAAAKGGCTPEVALLAIAQIIGNTDK